MTHADPDPVAGPGRVAAAYVERVNAADTARLLELFEPEAVLRHPIGEFRGLEQLRGFYDDLVFAGRAHLTLGRVAVRVLGPEAGDGAVVFFELTATSPLDANATVIETIDVADVDADGRITALGVYSR